MVEDKALDAVGLNVLECNCGGLKRCRSMVGFSWCSEMVFKPAMVSALIRSEQIRELVPESQAYMDLLAFERKLDQTIMRKRVDIQEALKRPMKVTSKEDSVAVKTRRRRLLPFRPSIPVIFCVSSKSEN